MAVQSANDLLGAILYQVQSANKYMEKISKNTADSNTKEATSGIKSKITNAQGKFSDITGAVKNLAQLNVKDVAKIAVMPLGMIAKKIKTFSEDLGSIDTKKANKALTMSKTFSNITYALTNTGDVTKLIATLKIYPFDDLNSFADNIKSLLEKLSSIKTTTLNPKIEEFSKIINSINDLNIRKLSKTLKYFGEKSLEKGLNGFSKFIDKLTDTFKEKFDKRQRESITEKIKGISDITKLLAGSLLKMSLLGILTPVLVPLSILGLVGVALYLKEFQMLSTAINKIGNQKNLVKISDSVKNVLSIGLMASGIVLASALVGVMITKPEILGSMTLGFVTIAATTIALVRLTQLIEKVGDSKNVAKGTSSVGGVLSLIAAAALIPIAAIAVGGLIMMTGWKPITIGLGVIALTLAGFLGISKIIKTTGEASKDSMKPALSIILLATMSIAIVVSSILIGKTIEDGGGWERLGNGMGAAAAVIAEFGVLGLLIGGMGKIISPTKMLIASALIIGIGAVTILLTKQVMNISEFFGDDIAAGWKKFGSTLGAMAAIVGEFGLLAMAMGALLTNPITGFLVVSGTALMLGLSGAIGALAGAMKKTLEVSEILGASPEDTDSTKAPIDNMVNFLANSKELLKEVSRIGRGLSFIGITKTIFALNGVVGALGEYAKILQTVGGKEGYIKGVSGYDDKGNPIYGEDVDIKLTSENLASGFSTFVTVVLGKLQEIDWGKFRLDTLAKISWLMNPISKFAKVIQEVGAEEGKIKGISGYDDNGNPIYGKSVDIVPVSENISKSFGIFAENVMTGLEKVSANIADFLKVGVIKDIMEPVSQFAKIIQDFGATDNPDELTVLRFDEEGKVTGRETVNIKTISSRVANAFTTFAKEMQKVTSTFKSKSLFDSQPDISDILEPITDAMADMKDKLTTSEVESFAKNINNISTSFESLQKIYVSDEAKALQKTLPNLTKKHVEFITKMNEAMKNIKSPMDRYVEQVERLANAYDKLSAKYDENGKLVLTLEENTNTNNNINVDKNALETLADDISSKINDGTREAINGISITMPNPVKNATMPTLSLEVSSSN